MIEYGSDINFDWSTLNNARVEPIYLEVRGWRLRMNRPGWNSYDEDDCETTVDLMSLAVGWVASGGIIIITKFVLILRYHCWRHPFWSRIGNVASWIWCYCCEIRSRRENDSGTSFMVVALQIHRLRRRPNEPVTDFISRSHFADANNNNSYSPPSAFGSSQHDSHSQN